MTNFSVSSNGKYTLFECNYIPTEKRIKKVKNEKIYFVTNCGHLVFKNEKYCPSCGLKIIDEDLND